jgi:16S rRNA (guanine527-N7)-methyltransferase
VLVRHVVESLAALPWVGEAGTLLDIGSGSGFPAIPVLLARPAVRGVLLEPRERRWAFLREVIREMELDAEAVRERAAEHSRGGYAVVTVRGVAVDAWFPHASRLAAGDGTVLWWTSRAKADALTRKVSQERVLTFPLPDSGRGCLAVWRRCST